MISEAEHDAFMKKIGEQMNSNGSTQSSVQDEQETSATNASTTLLDLLNQSSKTTDATDKINKYLQNAVTQIALSNIKVDT